MVPLPQPQSKESPEEDSNRKTTGRKPYGINQNKISQNVIGFSFVTIGDLNKGEWDAIFLMQKFTSKTLYQPVSILSISLLSSPFFPL